MGLYRLVIGYMHNYNSSRIGISIVFFKKLTWALYEHISIQTGGPG